MKTFTLFWLDGESEIVTGHTISDAFTRAGYGAGAIRALDFHAESDIRHNYEWDKEKHSWEATEAYRKQRGW